ncbi:MAG: LysM peptidoglycan-binding domain-containing protein [Bdellovibrionaceae bacterium]|nr:LysM peptidoglycan-binding domain-containing protein [Bdellovibrio sp.]
MTKNLLFIIATAGLILNAGGCTSKSSQDETQVIENADVDKIESEELAAPPQDPAATGDSSLQAALGETTDAPVDATMNADTTTTQTTTETVTTDVAAAPTLDETSLNNEVPDPALADTSAPAKDSFDSTSTTTTETVVTNTEEPTSVDSAASLTETPVIASSETSTTTTTQEASSSSSSSYVSSSKLSGSNGLKKIATTAPYQTKSGWVNTVYVARPGEKLKDISQTVFGSDKSKELKKISENSYLKSRSAKAGDKIYYVSPNRPDDSSKTLFYYEDMGMVPETYVAKKGDNLKKVAKEILGYDRAWVEMWTANPIESKTKLAEGDTIKYWRSASSINTASNNNNGAAKLVDANPAAAGTVAANTPPPQDMNALPAAPAEPPAQMAEAPPQDLNSLPPPPTGSELPPPPTEANALPPPPPPPDLAPPPPPPPIDAAMAQAPHKKNADEEVASGGLLQDSDTMMSLGAIGILFAALAFVLIRRKKKKAAEMAAMHDANVGT